MCSELTVRLFLGTLRPAWQANAACRGYPTDWWYDGNGAQRAQALRICAGCPVRDECREHARQGGEEGLWGGVPAPRGRCSKPEQEWVCGYCGATFRRWSPPSKPAPKFCSNRCSGRASWAAFAAGGEVATA